MAVLVISYARPDQPQVRAIVALLKAALRDIDKAVFWDGEFEAGDPWFEQIKTNIDAAPQLFVFWCAHSSGSKQVRREFEYAFGAKKRVVPVLLDDTQLCDELSPIAGIDLRGALIHAPLPSQPAELRAPTPMPKPATATRPTSRSLSRFRFLQVAAMAAIIVSLAGLALFQFNKTAAPRPPPDTAAAQPKPESPTPASDTSGAAIYLVVVTAVAIGLTVFVTRKLKHRRDLLEEIRAKAQRDREFEALRERHHDPLRTIGGSFGPPPYILPSSRNEIIAKFAAHIAETAE
jgi:TIR domain